MSDTNSHPTTEGHGPPDHGVEAHDDHDHHDIASHLKTYIGVFIALLVGTIITVSMYYVHFESMALTITVALFIASIKSFLVAAYFMHLISEKKAIYGILILSTIFFVALGGLTLWGMHDPPTGTEMKSIYVP